MKTMYDYAPILVPTLNRYEQLEKCVYSLSLNYEAQFTDLFIALDYPPSKKYYAGYKKVCDYVYGPISGFRSVTIIKRNKNYGPTRNINEARKQIFNTYNRLIISEDDNVFSSKFLKYINNYLDLFEDDSDVIGICGYSCPIDTVEDNNNIYLCDNCFSSWGYGDWKNKYYDYFDKLTMKKFRKYLYNNVKMNELLKTNPRSFAYYFQIIMGFKLYDTDLVRQLFMLFENKTCVMPKKSLVRNIGWDGSGVHKITKKDIDIGYSSQDVNESMDVVDHINHKIFVYDENRRRINEILPVDDDFLKKALRKRKMIMLFRPRVYFFFVDFIHIIFFQPIKKIKAIIRRIF
ncbi:MAG: glycosyltransferase [Clostridia bacterium]|nr:glycosyltransferase [Clostridia bacterium]